jgi:hypothetical protein
MSTVRNRLIRRRHRRAQPVERPGASADSPHALPPTRPKDPADRRTGTGMRPYEAVYDIALGYDSDRMILLP